MYKDIPNDILNRPNLPKTDKGINILIKMNIMWFNVNLDKILLNIIISNFFATTYIRSTE